MDFFKQGYTRVQIYNALLTSRCCYVNSQVHFDDIPVLFKAVCMLHCYIGQLRGTVLVCVALHIKRSYDYYCGLFL